MKTDTIFYEIFKEFPNIFFELIGQPEIDPNTYQFQAPEIKQLAFRLDGLFCPLAEFPHQPLYFVEIQFYNDSRFYERLFTSIFLYFSQYQPPNPDWYAFEFKSQNYQFKIKDNFILNFELIILTFELERSDLTTSEKPD